MCSNKSLQLIPTLRSNEYFGQYGKITKILLVKRTPPGGTEPVLGLYISYYRREDAARAIQAVDGAPSPSGGGEIMRASYGTTKYCIAFLRNASCTNHGCMDLHDWGDEKDCFTKEDLTTLLVAPFLVDDAILISFQETYDQGYGESAKTWVWCQKARRKR